jgi:hypothetical protein
MEKVTKIIEQCHQKVFVLPKISGLNPMISKIGRFFLDELLHYSKITMFLGWLNRVEDLNIEGDKIHSIEIFSSKSMIFHLFKPQNLYFLHPSTP